jgi:hypothetical protein
MQVCPHASLHFLRISEFREIVVIIPAFLLAILSLIFPEQQTAITIAEKSVLFKHRVRVCSFHFRQPRKCGHQHEQS